VCVCGWMPQQIVSIVNKFIFLVESED
jgi:hypothetical protein